MTSSGRRRSRLTERAADHCLRLGDDLVQVFLAPEALGIDLVDRLCTGGAGGKPAVLGHDLEATDRRIVAGSSGEDLQDRFTRQLPGRHLFRREPLERLLLLRAGGRIQAPVDGRAEALG